MIECQVWVGMLVQLYNRKLILRPFRLPPFILQMVRCFIIMIWMIIISLQFLIQCLQEIDFCIYIRSGVLYTPAIFIHRYVLYVLHKICRKAPPLDVGCLSQIMNKCEENAWKCLRGVHGRCNYKQTIPNLSENLFFWTNRASERWMFSLSYSKMRKCCRWPFMCSTGEVLVTRRCDGRETLF